jgi:Uma2 family endonuclease
MQPHKYLPNYTVEDYNRWEGDWELIDGIPYSMSPSPVRRHQQLAMALTLQIGNSIKSQKEKCGNCEAFYELDWILSDNTVLCPDIAITCNETGDFLTKAPVLIIEILSPSTALKDRHQKFEIYEKEGVRYYVIADPNSKTYQVYELVNGRYQEKNGSSSFAVHNDCAIEINLDEALTELQD